MSSNHTEYKGKDVDEAIAMACDDLKAARADLEIEIISPGSTGIFGLGRKKTVVRARRKSPAPEPSTTTQDRAAPRDKRYGKPDGDEGQQPVVKRHPVQVSCPSPNRAVPPEPGPPPPPEAIETIRDLTKTLLGLMGFELEVEVSHADGKVRVHISPGEHIEELVGQEGKVLDALQYILRKIVAQRLPGRLGLALDAGNYREDRQKELRERALHLARQVKETGRSQTMGALNPAERRIVHLTLKDDHGIRSASLGEGLFKKIKISLPGASRGRRRPEPGRETADSP